MRACLSDDALQCAGPGLIYAGQLAQHSCSLGSLSVMCVRFMMAFLCSFCSCTCETASIGTLHDESDLASMVSLRASLRAAASTSTFATSQEQLMDCRSRCRSAEMQQC